MSARVRNKKFVWPPNSTKRERLFAGTSEWVALDAYVRLPNGEYARGPFRRFVNTYPDFPRWFRRYWRLAAEMNARCAYPRGNFFFRRVRLWETMR